MRIKLFNQKCKPISDKNNVFSKQDIITPCLIFSKSHQKRVSGFDIILKLRIYRKEYGIGISTGKLNK